MRSDRITGNIFVANLPPGFTDARLADLFDPYGLVLIAHLARDAKTGAIRNHGLVDLAPKRAAAEAIEALDGQEIDGQRIAVRAADPSLALRSPSPKRRGPPRQAPPQAAAAPAEAPAPAGAEAPPAAAPRPATRTFVVERRPLRRPQSV
jgi:RNA recognition motif-containing protein